MKDGVGAAADKITGGVRSFVQRVRSFSVTSLVAKLHKYGQAMTGLGTLVADPMSTIEPYAEGIAGELSAGMPAAASDAVAPHMAAAVRGESRAPAASAVPAPVQRQVTDASTEAVARTTSSRAEMWAGLGAAFTDKWAKLDVKKMALDGLKSLVGRGRRSVRSSPASALTCRRRGATCSRRATFSTTRWGSSRTCGAT